MLDVAIMVELCPNGLKIPIVFLVDADGFAILSLLFLSIRFGLQDVFFDAMTFFLG